MAQTHLNVALSRYTHLEVPYKDRSLHTVFPMQIIEDCRQQKVYQFELCHELQQGDCGSLFVQGERTLGQLIAGSKGSRTAIMVGGPDINDLGGVVAFQKMRLCTRIRTAIVGGALVCLRDIRLTSDACSNIYDWCHTNSGSSVEAFESHYLTIQDGTRLEGRWNRTMDRQEDDQELQTPKDAAAVRCWLCYGIVLPYKLRHACSVGLCSAQDEASGNYGIRSSPFACQKESDTERRRPPKADFCSNRRSISMRLSLTDGDVLALSAQSAHAALLFRSCPSSSAFRTQLAEVGLTGLVLVA